MFTGIIEAKGKVLRVEARGQGKRLSIGVGAGLTDIQPGDSINVNGACLTVVEMGNQVIAVDLSGETLQKTTFERVREGDAVNLERALRLSDRLGGHIVTGHSDGIGTIVEKRREGEFIVFRIQVPPSVSRYTVRKGSIAIDGTSLTVNECQGNVVEMTLIPFTLEKTILMDKKVGDGVNVEADIVGKYIEKLLNQAPSEGVTVSFLREHGFMKGE
jgi:riboflavin synthase